MTDCLSILSTVITAVATVVMACYSVAAFNLSKKIIESQDEFQERTADLYKAIVIATILSSNTDPEEFDKFKRKFESVFDGKTVIFKVSGS